MGCTCCSSRCCSAARYCPLQLLVYKHFYSKNRFTKITYGIQEQCSRAPMPFLTVSNYTEPEFLNLIQRTNSAKLCSLAGRYDNPIPTQFLASIDCLKIPALYSLQSVGCNRTFYSLFPLWLLGQNGLIFNTKRNTPPPPTHHTSCQKIFEI
jgi:hypothetical protein